MDRLSLDTPIKEVVKHVEKLVIDNEDSAYHIWLLVNTVRQYLAVHLDTPMRDERQDITIEGYGVIKVRLNRTSVSYKHNIYTLKALELTPFDGVAVNMTIQEISDLYNKKQNDFETERINKAKEFDNLLVEHGLDLETFTKMYYYYKNNQYKYDEYKKEGKLND